ncbi:MAG: PAS domain S-box protein [Alphaproteobacteria bacterium]|nr:PAS domain S-box protein [Alphaproteobacteria bacterium]
MRTRDGGERRLRASRGVALGVLVSIAITVFAACFAIWDLHGERLADEMKETRNLGVVLAEQTARSFQAVDLVLQEIQAMASAAGLADPVQFRRQMATEEVHRFLVGRLYNLPQADAIALVDESGKIVNFSRAWPSPIIDTSDREYFRYLRDHRAAEAYIGPAIRSKVNGAWTITIARRVSGPDGEFLGLVAGYVEARYFEAFYEAISTSTGESVSLFGRDGTLLARYPHVDNMIGEQISTASPWYENVAKGGGTYRTPGYIGGVPRIVSVQPARGYPLAVTVGTSEQEALAPWRRQSMLIAVCALGAIVGFTFLFRALAVQFRRLEQRSLELAQSEARFRGFALTSSDWFWETDRQHRFTYISDGIYAHGGEPEVCIGRTRIDFAKRPEDDPAKWEEHQALLNRHEPFRDFRYTRKTGGPPDATASVGGDPFFDSAGQFLGYRGTARDITRQVRAEGDLREAKEAAEAANLAKSQFLANVSHELRTPLNAIIGFSEMLVLGLVGHLHPKQKEYAALVHQSGQHLLHVINDILDLAHVDSGRFELRHEDGVDPHCIIDTCVALMRDRATAGDLRLSTEIEAHLPFLVADPTRLKQILLNLLSNAIKFTEPGGSVTVAARRGTPGDLVFEVRDTGPGMTPEEVAIALEPFGQVDSTHARRHEGTGLGLPLAQRLAELHGGSLHIESEKGHGVTVTVRLPATHIEGDAIAVTEPMAAQ